MEPAGYIPPHHVTVGEPTERVSLHISCQNLPDLDIVSKSDPCCFVYLNNGGKNAKWEMLGKTETIENNLNPVFVTAFEIDFYFEKDQKVKFELYDIDIGNRKEFLGSLETSMARIMGSYNQTLTTDLDRGAHKRQGQITIKLEKLSQCNDVIYFTGKATGLPTTKALF